MEKRKTLYCLPRYNNTCICCYNGRKMLWYGMVGCSVVWCVLVWCGVVLGQDWNSHSRSLINFTEYRLISFTNFKAQLLYSLTIGMLHYNLRHVSSINMPIFRRTNYIITASVIVTLCSHPAYCTVRYRE